MLRIFLLIFDVIADDVFTYKLETKYFINVVLTRTAYGKLVKKKEQFVMDYRLLNTCMFVVNLENI